MSVPTDSDDVRTVHVSLGERSYDIDIGRDLLPSSASRIERWLTDRYPGRGQRSALIITDTKVEPHAAVVRESLEASGWKVECFPIESGEKSKRLEVVSQAWDRLIDFQADRRTVIVAVGGGVVGDAAGFVAATFARGIPFVQVPTTLLADVDSSVGGKVGINHPRAKNMIGAFHQPLGVLIDTDTLSTLPEREYRSGLGEVVKYGVILDAEFFEFLERNVEPLNRRESAALNHAISRSCEMKAFVVERDEFERTGLRAVLNYGHTFAHAYEALTGYGELLHGEAVSIGMVSAGRLAEKLGRIGAAETERQTALLQALRLPIVLPHPELLKADEVLARMQLDKKSVGGQLRFVLPTRIGHVETVADVPVGLVRETLAEQGIA